MLKFKMNEKIKYLFVCGIGAVVGALISYATCRSYYESELDEANNFIQAQEDLIKHYDLYSENERSLREIENLRRESDKIIEEVKKFNISGVDSDKEPQRSEKEGDLPKVLDGR